MGAPHQKGSQQLMTGKATVAAEEEVGIDPGEPMIVAVMFWLGDQNRDKYIQRESIDLGLASFAQTI
eukprot:1682308-Amphidinium_carterae.3